MRPARRTAVAMLAAVTAAVTVAVTAPHVAFADDGSYRTLRTAHNPDWMGSLPDDRSLAALSIPGTHDTLAVRGGFATATQENHGYSGRTLLAQLEAGIRRHLDRTSAGDRSLMYVNFGSDASIFAQPYQVAGGAGGTQGVNPVLLRYLNEGPEDRIIAVN